MTFLRAVVRQWLLLLLKQEHGNNTNRLYDDDDTVNAGSQHKHSEGTHVLFLNSLQCPCYIFVTQ